MANTATYEGPWDAHTFSKKDLDADKAYTFPKGVPVEISADLVEKLEKTGEKFSFDEVEDADEAREDAEAELEAEKTAPEGEAEGAAAQTGDAVSTPSTTTTGGAGVSGSTGTSSAGRTRSTRSSR